MKIAANLNILSPRILKKADAICFTSNGTIKKNGSLIMGAGNAKQFRDRFKNLDKLAGEKITKNGNHCQIIQSYKRGVEFLHVLAFPSKHNPWEDSDIELIRSSAKRIVKLADQYGWKKVFIPAPGVSHGNLRWADVRPVLEELLDDRFTICFYKPKNEGYVRRVK